MNRKPGDDLLKMIREKSMTISDPAGREIRCLRDDDAFEIAEACIVSVRRVYAEALRLDICPQRYVRNRNVISSAEQLKLAESKVAVVGAGGLGGHVIFLLARLGIGRLVVVDHDVFEETNLNRQALCDVNTIGIYKSSVAVDRVAEINPGVEVIAVHAKINSSNVCEILCDSHVVVDALDTIPDRFILEAGAKGMEIPIVHGALAGFEGRVMTIYPGDSGLELLYGDGDAPFNAVETPEAVLGVPAVTPSIIASFQVMEVIKILLDRGRVLRNMMIHIDLEAGRLEEFFFH
ncbi:MAG: ThiF family adenylyltransferase [Deltaproteobacteria bacterium]|nr:ThiF family adenylyltransferase [Deltaproteobacteria bacterium]